MKRRHLIALAFIWTAVSGALMAPLWTWALVGMSERVARAWICTDTLLFIGALVVTGWIVVEQP